MLLAVPRQQSCRVFACALRVRQASRLAPLVCLQAVEAGADALAPKPVVWVRYGEDGVATSVSFDERQTIDQLIGAAIEVLEQLHGLKRPAVAAYKATSVDASGDHVTIGPTPESTKRTLASLGTKADDDFVFKLRAQAAATGGATASGGKYTSELQIAGACCIGRSRGV